MKKIILFLLILISITIFSQNTSLNSEIALSSEVLANMASNILEKPDILWFKYGIFDVDDFDVNPIYPELKFKGFQMDFGYFIVQFDGETTEERKKAILDIASDYSPKAKLYYYVPNSAWVFRLHKDAVEKVEDLDFTKAVLPLHPSLKIFPDLFRKEQIPDSSTGKIRLKITVFQDDDYQELAKELAESGAEIQDSSRGAHHEFIRALIQPEKLKQSIIIAANFEGTEWIEREYPKKLHNDWSRWITQSYNFAGMTSGSELYAQMSVDLEHVPIYRRGLYGQNQIIGYLDSGLDTASIYFCDNSNSVPKSNSWTPPADTDHRKIRAYNTIDGDFDDTDIDMGGHGTHVGGSIAGDNETHSPTSGTYDPGDGMAPLARLVFTDGADGSSGIFVPSDMNTLFGYARGCGANIHSNSYGSDSPNSYNTDAQQCDEFMWDYDDFLIFFSAGNGNTDGYRVATYNCAKSIVSVGATESGSGSGNTSWANPGSSDDNNPEDMASFSSHGPTDEGAIRPTLAVPGGWYIWSADNIDGGSFCHTGMEYMGGTSMSCPTVAGMTALVRQYFTEGYYPSGSANASDAFTPSGALMKAMLISGTRNMTGEYTIDDVNNSGHQDVPSNGQGFGRVVLDDCMYFSDSYGTDDRKLILWDETTGISSTGESNTYFIESGPSTTEPIKIVLSYSDYPGSPAAGTPGVNDLDLIVEVDGTPYLGNVFATTGARSTTGGSGDQLNRDEVVWLDAVPNATITITVEAEAIRTSPQKYALVATGDIFIGEPNDPPETPGLTNKLFDNERQPSQRPTIEFTVPNDPDGDSLDFVFQYDDASDFSSPIGTFSTDAGDPGFAGGPFGVVEGSGDLKSYTFQSDLTDGNTYWWRVRAYDGRAFSAWTDVQSFTVETSMTNSDWFQTTDNQFQKDTPTDVTIGSDKVTVFGETVYLFDDFDSYSNQAEFETEWTTNGSFYSWQTSTYHSSPAAMRYNDDDSGSRSSFYHTFTPLDVGYAECWSMASDATDEAHIMMLYDELAGDAYKIWFYYREGYVALWDGPERHNLEEIEPGVWKHYRIDFDCGAGNYTIDIDGTTYGPFGFIGGAPSSLMLIAHGTLTHYTDDYTADVYYDDVKVAEAGFAGSGNIISDPIVFDWNDSGVMWDKVFWHQDAGDSIIVVCEQRSSGSWVVFDSAIAATSAAAGTLDIGGLGSADTIRLRAELAVKGSVEPDLYDWAVSWSNNVIGVELLQGDETAPGYTEWNLGMVNESDIRIMDETDRVYVNNSGGLPIDISISANPCDWTFASSPGVDECVVLGLFNGISAPAVGDFSSTNDLVITSYRNAGTGDGGNFATSSNDGVNINPGEGEELYFYFQAPSTNNQPATQNITINIQALPH